MVRVLVVDDEPLARRRLIRLLEAMPDVSLAGEAGNAQTALEQIRASRPDLVLLDIRMPGLSGLELAASERDLPPIVFTTAYDQYAVEAFEVSAVDYLLKPVEPERLVAALDKVRRRTRPSELAGLHSLLEKLERQVDRPGPTRISARRAGTTRLFEAHEITRIHASQKYALFVREGFEFVLDESLSTLEAQLAGEGFFRVHRAELVNLSHVRALHSEDGAVSVELSDGQVAPVSRRNVAALKQRLGIG
jgi:two-component system LytT family response regulator